MTATYGAIPAQPDLLRLGDDAVNFYLLEQHARPHPGAQLAAPARPRHGDRR
jgi:hypothetical protein